LPVFRACPSPLQLVRAPAGVRTSKANDRLGTREIRRTTLTAPHMHSPHGENAPLTGSRGVEASRV
jgi:hypothetical protein